MIKSPSGGATFSPCRTYRYDLWRSWQDTGVGKGYVMFIGLNPSTADEIKNDPTVRRCIGYAKAWGYSRLCMTNAFAYRATDPKDMMQAGNPVGPRNDEFLCARAAGASIVIAAWGTHGAYLGREQDVRSLLPGLNCLRLTKHGHPAHPLYLPKTLKPFPW